MEHERSTRRYLKPEHPRHIAERCRASDFGPGDLARRHGYALSILQRWLAEERRETAAFVLREVTPPAIAPSV